ncbi:MAG: DUF4350 domain-containing protein [Polyangiaceae bacterium]|nr:DUF4350 domain-containing protein [Polyangiaceae bacterium]
MGAKTGTSVTKKPTPSVASYFAKASLESPRKRKQRAKRILAERRLGLTRIGLCLTISLTISLAQASQDGEAFSTANDDWDGYSQLARIAQEELGAHRVHLLGELDYSKLRPNDTLLIAAPQGELNHIALIKFLQSGGRLIIADDIGKASKFLEEFKIGTRQAPMNPVRALLDNPSLALATPTILSSAPGKEMRHPLVHGIAEVVTNHSGAFQHPSLSSLLAIKTEDGERADIAISAIIAGKGRLIAIADPSLFINFMLRYPGNRQFAKNLFIQIKAEISAQPASSGDLYLCTGNFLQVGSFGSEPSLRQLLQSQLQELKKELQKIQGQGLPAQAYQVATTLLAILLLSQLLRLRDIRVLWKRSTHASKSKQKIIQQNQTKDVPKKRLKKPFFA